MVWRRCTGGIYANGPEMGGGSGETGKGGFEVPSVCLHWGHQLPIDQVSLPLSYRTWLLPKPSPSGNGLEDTIHPCPACCWQNHQWWLPSPPCSWGEARWSCNPVDADSRLHQTYFEVTNLFVASLLRKTAVLDNEAHPGCDRGAGKATQQERIVEGTEVVILKRLPSDLTAWVMQTLGLLWSQTSSVGQLCPSRNGITTSACAMGRLPKCHANVHPSIQLRVASLVGSLA